MDGKSNRKKDWNWRMTCIETLKDLLCCFSFLSGLMGLEEPLQRMKNIARSSQSQAHLSWGSDLEPTVDGENVAKLAANELILHYRFH